MPTATKKRARPALRKSVSDKPANGVEAAPKPAAGTACLPTVTAQRKMSGWFTVFAQKTAQLSGRPGAFMLAATTILVWGVTGPLFGYSDTWQLVINTGTTIVTFLMVFLIQNSQNRDSLAFQLKLDELIIAVDGAENRMAGAEDLCDEDLEQLHDEYRKRAAETLETLAKRRGAA
ncbi:MAG: low affinity iron permease family protein [Hyphomicrobiales bacterium]